MNKRLNKIAGLLEGFAFGIINLFAWGLEMFSISLAFAEGRYRQRGPRTQRIVQRIVYMPDRRYRLVNTKTGEVL